ncbi:MAG: trehalose-phosphatase [Acidimicrobiia bacterium]|nr:trehalose-phosphatase [Acidimicrobiia bacterium]
MTLDQLIVPLRDDPASAAIFCDFDGTLSPIVADPATARPLTGVRKALGALVEPYGLVAVVSGRPVDFLEDVVPDGVVVSGLYGLESLRDGVRTDLEGAGVWREVVQHVATASRAGGPLGMLVESKGLSLTLHYRANPELADEVKDWADAQAVRSGLLVRPARMSVELHPPIECDKGTAVRTLVDGLRAALYIGDDAGDLPAFTALDALAIEGAAVAKVAVRSPEAPEALLDAADAVVDGPSGALHLLRALLPDPASRG